MGDIDGGWLFHIGPLYVARHEWINPLPYFYIWRGERKNLTMFWGRFEVTVFG